MNADSFLVGVKIHETFWKLLNNRLAMTGVESYKCYDKQDALQLKLQFGKKQIGVKDVAGWLTHLKIDFKIKEVKSSGTTYVDIIHNKYFKPITVEKSKSLVKEYSGYEREDYLFRDMFLILPKEVVLDADNTKLDDFFQTSFSVFRCIVNKFREQVDDLRYTWKCHKNNGFKDTSRFSDTLTKENLTVSFEYHKGMWHTFLSTLVDKDYLSAMLKAFSIDIHIEEDSYKNFDVMSMFGKKKSYKKIKSEYDNYPPTHYETITFLYPLTVSEGFIKLLASNSESATLMLDNLDFDPMILDERGLHLFNDIKFTTKWDTGTED